MPRDCSRRARRTRRRSRSLIPPQIPNFSPFAMANSRQSSRTTQPRQTSFASRVDDPRSGKNSSGSTPMQLARDFHSGSPVPRIAWICTGPSLSAAEPHVVVPTVELHRCDYDARSSPKVQEKISKREKFFKRRVCDALSCGDVRQNRPTRSPRASPEW